MLGDQDGPVIDAEMVDRAPGNRLVGRPGSQGVCDEFLPGAGVAARGGVNHAALHSAVPADSGHDDPHQVSLSPAAAFRRAAWKDAIAVPRDHVIVQVGAYAGLASPLLHPLGLDSFTADFSGRSTRGQTITAMAALSCRADPNDRSEGMLTWQTASAIGVEKRLNLVSGLTVVVDETHLAKDPALVDTVLYMIPKNHGRPQGGGWPNMIPWRAVAVSTGEQPATLFTSR